MGLRPTQGDEKRLLSSNRSLRKRPSLCHPPARRAVGAYPDFLLRGTKDDLVCGFHQGKPHELCGTIALNRKSGAAEDLQFSQPTSHPLWKRRSPLCHPERTRISYYAAPKMTSLRLHQGKPHELCGTHRPQQEIRGSRGICSSADLSWKCFSTERLLQATPICC